MKQHNGFTLVELMVTLAIIAIIASIAVPSYQSNVIKSSRGEGMTALLDIMRAQEDYFVNNYEYTTSLTDLNYAAAVITDSGRYSITAEKCDSENLKACVNLVAAAQNGQLSDGDLELNSRGVRSRNNISGWTK